MEAPVSSAPTSTKTAQITLGGGCFWCLEAIYQKINGVISVVSGYAGGSVPNPTYDAVCTGKTGHAEVVQVTFDPAVIPLEDILEIFWAMHDPTTRDRQGNDVGSQYRSIILWQTPEQQAVVEASRAAVAKLWPDPIVTEIAPLQAFYPAEAYHQDYFKRNPAAAYCQIVINPKLAKLKTTFRRHLSAA